jgi:chemosensory pili system protein ChpC
MDAVHDKIRSLWVPLREMNLLLPSVAVAEVSSYRVPEVCADVPEWFLGMVKWREQMIPLITLEAICGLAVPSNPVFSRLMVLNSVRQDSPVTHYAIVTAGLPGLIQFDPDTADEVSDYQVEGLRCIVRVGNEEAVIPDLDYLQTLLEQQLAAAA